MREDIAIRIEKVSSGAIPDGYVKERVGIMPFDWKVQTVEEVLDIQNELRTPISKEVRETMEGQYPYYGPTQIQGYINTYNVEGPAVLIGEDGDHFLKYKEKEMTLFVDGKYSVNNHAHIVRGTARCRDKWFMYAFQHKNLFDSITRQGAGRYKLTKDTFAKMEIQIPTIEEQDKIIAIIENYDYVISKIKEKIEQKKRQKKWLMQNLLAGKKRLSKFSEEWKTIRLGDCFEEVDIRTITNNEYPVLTSSRKGIFFQSDYFNKSVASNDNTGYKVISVGEFTYRAMSDDGTYTFNIQEICDKGIVSPAYAVFKVKEGVAVSRFLYYLMNDHSFNRYLRIMEQGGTRQSLNYDRFCEIKIKIPKYSEQHAIAEVLITADKEIELLQKKLELIKQEKKAMMQLLLTGIVRVN